MALPALALVIFYGLIVTLWKVVHILLLFYQPRRFFLHAGKYPGPGPNGPLVSILLPAKDEEVHIADCIRSVLSSEYRNFELIVIEDRSTDGTAREIEKVAADDQRVRLLRIRELPPGWTGKMNAVRQGLAQARGDLFLIMDADSRHSPQTLQSALAAREHHSLDLLSLVPRIENPSFFSKVIQSVIGVVVMLWKPLPWVNSSKPKHRATAMGWGGFMLLRPQALTAIGGLEAVRDLFAADIGLARLLKRDGFRVRILHAPELVSITADSWPASISRWTRTIRIMLDNRSSLVLVNLILIVLLCLTAYPAIIQCVVALIRHRARPFNLVLGGLGVMHLFFQITFLGRLYRMNGTHPIYALGHFPGILFSAWMMVLTLIRCFSSRMAWRGTQYNLSAEGRVAS
jgi:glycosyltransferase involved in cell wall biosynthesis